MAATAAAWFWQGAMTMRKCHFSDAVLGFVVLALLASTAGGQTGGSIIGWGQRVVVPQSEMTNLTAIAAGGSGIGGYGSHGLGLRHNGTIVAWGGNDFGQCNVPAPNSDFIAIAAG